MTWTAILAALGGVTGIVGGVVWFFKRIDWQLTPTEAQTDASIDKANQTEEQQEQSTGRPQ